MRIQKDGKTISLDKEEVMRLCRPGAGPDTCIWLAVAQGFECLYYNRAEGRDLAQGETLEERWKRGATVAKRDGCDEVRKTETVIFVGEDEGRWPKGSKVRKINSNPDDTHQDGSQGVIAGAMGPISPAVRAEMIIKHTQDGIDCDVEYIYWVEWDDRPGIPVAIADNRIEPVS